MRDLKMQPIYSPPCCKLNLHFKVLLIFFVASYLSSVEHLWSTFKLRIVRKLAQLSLRRETIALTIEQLHACIDTSFEEINLDTRNALIYSNRSELSY